MVRCQSAGAFIESGTWLEDPLEVYYFNDMTLTGCFDLIADYCDMFDVLMSLLMINGFVVRAKPDLCLPSKFLIFCTGYSCQCVVSFRARLFACGFSFVSAPVRTPPSVCLGCGVGLTGFPWSCCPCVRCVGICQSVCSSPSQPVLQSVCQPVPQSVSESVSQSICSFVCVFPTVSTCQLVCVFPCLLASRCTRLHLCARYCPFVCESTRPLCCVCFSFSPCVRPCCCVCVSASPDVYVCPCQSISQSVRPSVSLRPCQCGCLCVGLDVCSSACVCPSVFFFCFPSVCQCVRQSVLQSLSSAASASCLLLAQESGFGQTWSVSHSVTVAVNVTHKHNTHWREI